MGYPALGPRSSRGPTRTVSLLAVVALVFAGGAVSARADTGVGSWSATGTLSEGWAGGSAVTLADGRVFAVGGGKSGTTELYDPSSGTWTRGPDVPAGGRWTVVALVEGGALLLGETQCTGPKGECIPAVGAYRLSANGSEFSPAAPMREARVSPIAVQLPDGRVLVAGGFGDECPETVGNGFSCGPILSAEIYDPASNEWSVTASMPQARSAASATLLSDGTVLVVGGDEARDAIRYDPGSASWTAAGETALWRGGSLLFALPGDQALTVGDESSTNFFGSLGGAAERQQRDCKFIPISSEIFAAGSDAWMASLTVPTGSENCARYYGALLAGGQILLGSSRAEEGGALSSPYVLDPEQRCWSTTAPPLEPRYEGTVVALPDGRALAFGGLGAAEQQLSSAEIYAPGLPTCDPPAPTPARSAPAGLAPAPPRFAGVSIARRKRLTVTAAGWVRLPVQCPMNTAGGCVGHVQLALPLATSTGAEAKGGAKHLLLGEAPFAVAAGRTAWVAVHLTGHRRALHALMRRRRHTTIVLTTTAHDDTGQAVTTIASALLRGLPSV